MNIFKSSGQTEEEKMSNFTSESVILMTISPKWVIMSYRGGQTKSIKEASAGCGTENLNFFHLRERVKSTDPSALLPVYKAFSRRQMEYVVQSCASLLVKDNGASN